MAGGRDAGAVGGGAGGTARERAPRRKGSQRAGGRGGASAGGAAGSSRSADPGAGGGRAVRRARGGAHRGRGRPPARRLQARPLHAHHARDSPPPRARPHQLDEHVAAILKVSIAMAALAFHHRFRYVAVATRRWLPFILTIGFLPQKLNAKRYHHHQPPVHDRETKAVPERGGVSEP